MTIRTGDKRKKENEKSKLTKDMLKTQAEILNHVAGIDLSLKELVRIKRLKYSHLL